MITKPFLGSEVVVKAFGFLLSLRHLKLGRIESRLANQPIHRRHPLPRNDLQEKISQPGCR